MSLEPNVRVPAVPLTASMVRPALLPRDSSRMLLLPRVTEVVVSVPAQTGSPRPGKSVPKLFTVTLPTLPVPLSVAAALTVTLPADGSGPLTIRLPPLTVVGPL